MEIELICVGKTFQKFVNEGFKEFEDRLKHYCKFTYKELKFTNSKGNIKEDKLKRFEGELILNSIKSDSQIVLLDEKGQSFTSIEFSKLIELNMIQSVKKICFVIGGAYGFSDEVYKRAHSKISMSSLTFSHQMIRLIFVEQLYRAFTIIKGEKYHHR
jgi:23S rRNA (pseudouridine1915-N3)-methyltransferase